MKKRCTKCGETKPFKMFSKDKRAQDGYRSQCKACDKVWKQSQKGQESIKKYSQSEEAKEKARISARRYMKTKEGEENRKQYAKSERGKQSRNKYAKSEKGKQVKRRANATRRTNATQAGGSYSQTEWHALCKFYDFHCLKCDKKLPFKKLTVDHIRPVSRGGSSHIWNLQPLCKRCNRSKHNREIDYRKTLPPWLKRDGPAWQQGELF